MPKMQLFPPPKGIGWLCFHCGERCLTQGAATLHFGADQGALPACQLKGGSEFGLIEALRKSEEVLARYRNDDSDVLRILYEQQAEHRQALIRAEEEGYAKGLRDGRSEPLLIARESV